MTQTLYTSSDLRKSIRSLFIEKHKNKRRVVCVAYIGADCMDFIPYAKNLEVYCWPQAGGTNPIGLNRLLKAGAKVFFIDGLHTKVYWTDGVGAVVTSANLSRNALEEGNLLELGIYLEDSSLVNIEQILNQRPKREAKKAEINRLKKRSDLLSGLLASATSNVSSPVTFEEWYSSPIKMPWKLAWTDEGDYPLTQSSEEYVEGNYSGSKATDWSHARKDEYKPGDWLLCFSIDTGKVYGWMFITDVVPKRKGEQYWKDSPFMALQVGKRPPYSPFSLTPGFKKSFKNATTQYGLKKIQERPDSKVPQKLLKLLKDQYQSQKDSKIS